jgi:hypothetical protein
LEVVLKRLVDDFKSELDGSEENVRLLNFISYLQWRKGDRQQALAYASKVKEYGEEIRSLVYFNNEIIFRKEGGEISEYESLLEKAKQLHLNTEEYEEQKTNAIAEIAYCYSRLGPYFHAKAIGMYRDAIKRNRYKNPEWEFGLALTLRRQSHPYTLRDPKAFNPEKDENEAIDILKSIKDSKESELAARAWVELGVVYWSQYKEKGIFNARKKSEHCFETAMKLRPGAYFVLQRYGQHLRYFGKLEQSKKILQKSIQLNDTVFVRHHLALTLRAMALESLKTGKPLSTCIFLTTESNSETCQLSNSVRSENRDERGEQTQWPRGQLVSRAHDTKMYQTEGESLNSSRDVDNQDRLPSNSISTQNVPQQTRHRQRNPNRGHERQHSVQKRTITWIKSPKVISYLPGNQLLEEAVSHLKEALKMNTEFDTGRYELGLIYRHLKQQRDAIDCFSMITCNRAGKTSEYKILVINAYEQQAICKMELADMERNIDLRRKLKNDGKKLLWKSLETASLVILKIHPYTQR